jgi:Ca2+-binding RTX toxin-like protein
VATGDGSDTVTVQSGGLPAVVNIDGGLPNAPDSVTILGTAGNDSFTVAGSSVTGGGTVTNLVNVEHLAVDVSQAAATEDLVTVNQPITLSGGTPSLSVIGGGAGTDRLVINTATGVISQVVGVDNDSVDVVGQISVGFTAIDALDVNTDDGGDSVTVAVTVAFGAVTVNAGAGADTVNATASTVGLTLNGDAGNDTVLGGGGNDSVNGAGNDDSIDGGGGNDTLLGGGGHDVLAGGAGNDSVSGQGGNDTLSGGLGNDTLNGNLDTDIVSETADVSFTLTNTQLTGLGTDNLAAIEGAILTGGAGANAINAAAFTNGPVTLSGLGGNDTLTGGALNDVLLGGDHDDSLVGGPGNDTMSGGNGNDTLVWNDGHGSDSVDGDAGTDTLRVNGSASAEAFQVGPNGVRFSFTRTTGGAFTLNAGTVETLQVNSGSGNDTITVNDLTGVANLTTISADGGADSDTVEVNGSAGADTFDINNLSVLYSGRPAVNYSAIEQLKVNGLASNDVFNVSPSLTTVYTIDGGLPSAPASPGDTINFFPPLGQSSTVLATKITTTGGYQDVFHTEIETFGFVGDITVLGTNDDDVLEITATGSNAGSYVLTTNGIPNPTVNISGVTSFTFNALGDNDRMIINNPVVGVFGPAGGIFYHGGAGIDDLELNAGTATAITYTFTNATDGTIAFDAALLTYTGLNPIEDNVAAVNRFFVFGGAADVVVLTNGSPGRSIVSSNNGETVDFVNPSGVVSVSTGGGHDSVDATGSTLSVYLLGGDGNDTLKGGTGNDSLSGGLGSDSLNGGAGTDRLVETGNVNFILTNTQLTGGFGTDTLSSIERAQLTGGASANNIDASAFTAGSVTLDGSGGNDTLRGGSGDDLLTGGLGSDSIAGGAGFDTLREIGDVNFTLSDTQLTGVGTDSLAQIELAHLTGGASNNTIDATNFLGRTTIEGLGGNDTLVGGAVQDLLIGGEGNDHLNGKLGKDTLDGGLGNDTLLGGATADSLVGGDGDDKLDGQGGGNDTLIGGAGNDTLDGGEGADALSGGSGNDLLNGKGANDSILGGAGDDTMYGGAGNDLLLGGDGNDTILGQGGTDSGTGGGNGVPVSGGDSVDVENDLGFMFVFDPPWDV